ncbi:MAG: hypothetical protein H0V18_02300 [Pyrinomonadaceae bacterium]|nr:hypothetical protein [Pyrinomonadaceae bacterium]
MRLYAQALIVPSAGERQAAIAEFSTGARGCALRRVVENQTLRSREFNRAFVLAQYFGYLRRNPDDPPDNNLAWANSISAMATSLTLKCSSPSVFLVNTDRALALRNVLPE